MKSDDLIAFLMKDNAAGLKTDAGGRRYFRQRRVEFRTIDLTARSLHGRWLHYDRALEPLNWKEHPEGPQIRSFAKAASERFLDFWYLVFDVAVARALSHRDHGILRYPIFAPGSYFDIGVPPDADDSSVPPSLHAKILREYEDSRSAKSEFGVSYLTEFLETLNADWIARLAPFRAVWDLAAERRTLSDRLALLEPREESDRSAFDSARSVLFYDGRAHRIRLRLLLLRTQNRRADHLRQELRRAETEIKQRLQVLAELDGPDARECREIAAESLDLSNQIERFYVEQKTPGEERALVKEACREILDRLRPVRRTTSGYSLIPGERHGAMSLNPVMRLWKEKPNPPRADAPALTLEMNTKQTVDCLFHLAVLADPDLPLREIERGRIAKLMRGQENLANLKSFLLPGSIYPLREIHPLDFPEFRARVIGETRSPVELGGASDCVLTGAWYSKRQHSLYCTVGADNGRLLRILWNSERSPGPPAFFFAIGQYVHDCLEDALVYRKTGAMTFRECVEDYYDFEDRIRKHRGEKTGRRRADNSRGAVRFMFAVLYSRMITEILTGSLQSQFRHPATEKWMETNLGLSRDREKLRLIRIRLRERIGAMPGPHSAHSKDT